MVELLSLCNMDRDSACLQVVQLHNRHLLLPKRYPRFTLLGQALGSVRLGYEALTTAVPEVTAIDSPSVPACNEHNVHAHLGLQQLCPDKQLCPAAECSTSAFTSATAVLMINWTVCLWH